MYYTAGTNIKFMNALHDNVCWYCGVVFAEKTELRYKKELHHCLHHRQKGKHARPEFDNDINLMRTCKFCHDNRGHGYAEKAAFLEYQIIRLGYYVVWDWYISIPVKFRSKELLVLFERLERKYG